MKVTRQMSASSARQLVELGWEHSYRELFGDDFVRVLAPHHREAIEWHWNARLAFLEERDPDYLAYFPIWPRGHMKSTIAERMVVIDAVLSVAYDQPGFALYIGREKDKVKEHISNIEALMTTPKVRQYAPKLSEVARNEETNQKRQWTATFLHTQAGYVVKGGSIESSQAGARIGDTRPTFIVPDDIDGREDSPVISEMRFNRLTREILPMRQGNTLVYFAQNLISRYSVMYRIQSGKAKVLVNRKPTFPVPAVRNPIYEEQLVNGILKDVIVSGESTWQFWDMKRIQDEIDTEGLTAFRIECNHEVEFASSGRVISNFDESRQIIGWSDFERVYGERRIPRHWQCWAGLDVGYSGSTYPHYSAWVFVATAAMNSHLPGKVFVYRSVYFKHTSIDDQADAIKELLWPDEHISMWKLSHEKTGEMMTLNEKHELPFSKFTYYKPEDGVPQWQHYSRPNQLRANSFLPDERDGERFLIGDCELFYIVDDDQVVEPKDDKGQVNLRRQVSNWEYVPVKLTESGQTVQKPSKTDEDGCDALKGLMAYFQPYATGLSKEEAFMASIPEEYKNPDTEQQKVARHLWMQKQAREQHQKEISTRSLGSSLDRFSKLRGKF